MKISFYIWRLILLKDKMVLKGYKYRIYPSEPQRELIEKTFGVCRLVYNVALQVKKEAYKINGTRLTWVDLCNQLTETKRDFDWMREVDSQALQASIRKLDRSFANFFSGSGFPKFKCKKNRQSFQCPGNTRRIDWEKSTLTISKIKDIPVVLDRRFDGKIKTVTISRTPTGRYFASVLAELPITLPAKPAIRPETTIGVDLGIKSYVVSSDGRRFEPNRHLKNGLARLKCLARRVSRKKKGSNNRKKSVKSLARIYEKITNQRADQIHKITHELTHDNQVNSIVVEDLHVAGMLKNRKLSQAISDVGFGEFVRQLKYKCDWYGKNFIQIGRFEPSSKRCSECGSENKELTLSDREWICENCGVLHDRDFNAAKNIRKMGLHNHSAGVGSSGEPVEKRRLRRSVKQENTCV